MKIGIMTGMDRGAATPVALAQRLQEIEAQGFHSAWIPQGFAFDTIDTLSLAGHLTSKLVLGTAVTPTYPRHPTALATQALTAASICGGRFVLGIGLSHKVVIEGMLGLSFDKPARHMREYLSILMPALRGEAVTFEGETLTARNFQVSLPGVEPPKVVVAALGPVMLRLAGRMADGTITWMVGPRTMEQHVLPELAAAAAQAGRPAPMVVAGLPIALAADPAAAREKIAKTLQIYGTLPSYRAMLDREGPGLGPADIAVVGDERALRAAADRLAGLGVTHLMASVMNVEEGATQRTRQLLAELAD
ncbi:MAG: TIGR03564 family F420-dependent LLM class oxidoreductase [Caulobacteraceae bacterium]|nr:TIGR03564 family F420-dependent LLM class oxidoreductase [Caulobacteraceae bacterium]